MHESRGRLDVLVNACSSWATTARHNSLVEVHRLAGIDLALPVTERLGSCFTSSTTCIATILRKVPGISGGVEAAGAWMRSVPTTASSVALTSSSWQPLTLEEAGGLGHDESCGGRRQRSPVAPTGSPYPDPGLFPQVAAVGAEQVGKCLLQFSGQTLESIVDVHALRGRPI